MALTYQKLAFVVVDIADETTTRAAVMVAVDADELEIVNLKGRILTPTEVAAHLDGGVDGEELAAYAGTDAER